MRSLANNVARLTASRRAMSAAIENDDGRLELMRGFGSNPGALGAHGYVPDNLPSGAPLVVVLHGCTQTASVYDKGSGWSQLAERHGFAVLFPEQRRANNPNLCFNWYVPGDARRAGGEALSIKQMVEHMIARHQLDPSRVFVTGLSAGGAMTAVMLAVYPELFAAGAIIAGLPFGTANTLPEALARMRGHGEPSRPELAERARAAAPNGGGTPRLSVWHGTRDTIVDPANSVAIVDQWRDLHGLGTTGGVVEFINGHRREVWSNAEGREIIEKYDVQGMGHGTPLDTTGGDAYGTAGPHMLPANICSTRLIARFWGLTGVNTTQRESGRAAIALVPSNPASVPPPPPSAVGAVIERALRTAGLMH